MESWPHIIWFKRILPFVLIAAGWFGWRFYDQQRERATARAELDNALVTAQLWVAATRYRHDPARYETYRDSLLSAHDLTDDQLTRFLRRYENSDDDPSAFTKRVNTCVDSLIALERGGVAAHPDTSGYE
ncbi:MAG: hypothetical protein RBT76_08055 [candidate division Zixibacteria bacterium]|jgi:hypothetical protein|nr:hypothetical protein [candidate division Zixibacteria bacterium]